MSGARHPSIYMLIDVPSIASESLARGLAASVFLVSKFGNMGLEALSSKKFIILIDGNLASTSLTSSLLSTVVALLRSMSG